MSTALVDPPTLFASGDAAARERSRRRWEVWRSPDDQPPWARPALLGIAVTAAFLFGWNIQQAGFSPFYSVAVKSMSVSWQAFIFGAFDPKATITIDKLAGSFLPQALSARVFGYHAWSLALPQVIEGFVSVLVIYRVVRRWAGAVPGILAAVIFALTPIAASMFGHSMEDGALTMCIVLAADSYQRAVTEARLRSLIWAGVWVGIGFQAKMLQAWMVLPALAIGYLVAAPTGLRRRLLQLGIAGVVMLAVSLSWITLYTFTPANDRPWVDGSVDNSAFAMVFGYNGLERFGISVPGAVTSGPGVTTGGGAGHGGGFGGDGFGGRGAGAGGTGTGGVPGSGSARAPAGGGNGAAPVRLTSASAFGTGWTKLLGNSYGPEIGWLYPLAILSLIFGLVWTRRAKRSDQVRGGFVMWGIWLLTFGVVFSKMSTIPHTAYMASLAPPLAALSAAGIVMFWRQYRAGGWRAWLLPAAVAAELAWTLFLWRDYDGFLPWAKTAALVAGVAAIIVLAAGLLSGRGLLRRLLAGRVPARLVTGRLVTGGLVVGVVAMLAAPATWAASVLDTKYAGTSLNASAGPDTSGGFGGAGGGAPGGVFAFRGDRPETRYRDRAPGGTGEFPGGGRVAVFGIQSATEALTTSEREIYDYVSSHRDGASYLMAVTSWDVASPYIVSTGQEEMPMGGFSGTVPEPSLAHVRELVSSGQLRFFLLGGAGGGGGIGGFAGGGSRGSSTVSQITSWVESSCTLVPDADYGGTGTLYECH